MGLRVQRFCCCCSLKTGTLVIGTVGWIFTLLEIFFLFDSFREREQIDEDDLGNRKLQEQFERSFRVNWFTKVGYGVVALIICVLLVVGTYRKDKRFMLPWLVLKCFEACVSGIVTIILFIVTCAVDEERGLFFVLTLLCIIITGIDWYCWLCVYSHYRDLKEEDRQGSIPPVYYSQANAPPPTYNEVEKAKMALP